MISTDIINFLRFDIEQFLKTYAGQSVLYHPNPGNAGDSLIATGTFQAFKRHNIASKTIDLAHDVEGQTVFLGGGGNFIPLYDDIQKAFDAFLGSAAKIVLLPHTIRGNEQTLARIDQTCTLFCRDLESFTHVERINPAIDARLAHDMAFHADIHALLKNEAIEKAAQPILIEKLKSIGLDLQTIRSWPSIDMLRVDAESTIGAPQTDIDLSDLFMLGVTPETAEIAAWCFLQTIKLAQNINTDRLHIGIGAALVGTPCTLRDNSYGKNKAVFNHSLKYANIGTNRQILRFKPSNDHKIQDKLPLLTQNPPAEPSTTILLAETAFALTNAQAEIDVLNANLSAALASESALKRQLANAIEDNFEKDETLEILESLLKEIGKNNDAVILELDHLKNDVHKRGNDLNAIDRLLNEAKAEIFRLETKLNRHQDHLVYKIAHIPRGLSRLARKPFAMLAFHKSGRPRGWVRKLAFHSNGTPRSPFKRLVLNKDGEPRKAFKAYLTEKGFQKAPSSLPPTPKTIAPRQSNTILIAADFPPLHDQHSGGLRLKTIIEMIGKQKHPMVFVSSFLKEELPGPLASEEGRDRYETALKAAGVTQFIYGADEFERLLATQSIEIDQAFLSFPSVAEKFLPILRDRSPETRIYYDMVDFHALRMEREASLTGDPSIAAKAMEMKQREIALANAADVTIAVSTEEKRAILDLAPISVVDILPNIFELPKTLPPGPESRKNILFIGGFWHTPNGDAATWFVNAIWPLIKSKAPGCQFLIAGSNPGPDVLELDKHDGVHVLGYVEDLTPLYDSVRVSIAPLRFGAGVKGKVGQAMALGLPVVATPIGAEGMLTSTNDHFHIASEPAAFANAVLALLNDDDLWMQTQANARHFVESKFSVQALETKISELFHA